MDKKLLSDLGTKMLEKAITEGKCKSGELVRYYIDLLEKQNRIPDALKFLLGAHGSLVDALPYDRKTMTADLFSKYNQFAKANGIYASLLSENK